MKKNRFIFCLIILALAIFFFASCNNTKNGGGNKNDLSSNDINQDNKDTEDGSSDLSDGSSSENTDSPGNTDSSGDNIDGEGDNDFTPDDDNKDGDDEFMKNETDTYFGRGSEIMVIFSNKNVVQDAAFKLIGRFVSEYLDKKGYAYSGYISSHAEKEIIVGLVPERSQSVEAYRLLSEMESKSSISESRYLVYADSGKVAIAYEENEYTSLETIGYVVDLFFEKSIKDKDYALFEKGTVMSGTLNLIELQKEIDDKNNALRWQNVEKAIGDEDIFLAFKAFFDQMFTDEIVELIASYYDPATGLFYSSASGKKAEGIYPNPEATSMILSYVLNTGMLNGMGVRYLIPDIARYKIVYYLKSIQDENGEFYVSQMPRESIDSNRLGRDRGACVGLLERLGASPTYSVASMVGDGIDGEEYWADLVARGLVTESDKPIIYYADKSSVVMSRSFSSSVATAVSAVTKVSDGTSQFRSHVDFIKWLLAKDPYNNPYSAMSNTSSAASLISDWSGRLGGYDGDDTVVSYGSKFMPLYKGDTLNEILIRWMNDNINSAGLFGKVSNNYDEEGNPVYDGFFGGWGYQNSNGFFKAIGRYSEMGIVYPEARKAAESLLLGINSDEPVSGNVLVIYNVWSSLNSLRSNIRSYYTASDKDELLLLIDEGLKRQVNVDSETGKTKAYAAIAIDKCTKKILAFKKSDGGFGHAVNYSTPNWQGGLKVAVSSDNLSDIDAITCSSMSLGNALASLFGFNMLRDVPMNNLSDVLSFIDIMQNEKNVIKFDPNGELPMRKGVKLESFDYIPENLSVSNSNSVNKLVITEKDGDKRLFVNKAEHGFTCFSYKTNEQFEDYYNTTIIGFDILVENVVDTSGIEVYLQKENESMFLPYFFFESGEDGAELKVLDHKSGEAAVYSEITIGEWASVQIRYYGDIEKYDLFVNGSYIMSGSYLRSGTEYPKATEINGIKIAMATENIADFYFDNLYFEYLSVK